MAGAGDTGDRGASGAKNAPMKDAPVKDAPLKDAGAMLTIGELSQRLGVATHILRYWETRFPQLKPLQRSGNRRYYRPEDVALATRIHRLLNEQGYTVKGAQQALKTRAAPDAAAEAAPDAAAVAQTTAASVAQPRRGMATDPALIERLIAIRARLAQALEAA